MFGRWLDLPAILRKLWRPAKPPCAGARPVLGNAGLRLWISRGTLSLLPINY
jgi:hypothetical protein